MNFDPATPEELNFDPTLVSADTATHCVAEASIVMTIVQGSGGPDNHEITEAGLRFVRHLMVTSKGMRFGFMPNFKDMESIRKLAQNFIRRSGGATAALQNMHSVIQID